MSPKGKGNFAKMENIEHFARFRPEQLREACKLALRLWELAPWGSNAWKGE